MILSTEIKLFTFEYKTETPFFYIKIGTKTSRFPLIYEILVTASTTDHRFQAPVPKNKI